MSTLPTPPWPPTSSSWPWAKLLAYTLFVGLFLFELLNYLGVLSFQVEFTWLGRMISTAGVFFIIVALDAISRQLIRLPLSHGVLLCGTVLLSIDFWGDILSLYQRYPWYDQVAYFLSGPILVGAFLLLYVPIVRRLHWRVPPAVVAIGALFTSVFLAVIYELEEYTEDAFYGTNRLGDGADTANDLALNLAGGLIMLVGIALVRSVQKQQQRGAAV